MDEDAQRHFYASSSSSSRYAHTYTVIEVHFQHSSYLVDCESFLSACITHYGRDKLHRYVTYTYVY